ncbi:hypothetical protein QFC21_003107 [Naganishia friedmannii]|uniref:Uncharacterized protein n=1 Tax=Naganishia friedmannii TaxID=89922 RepID=A0ACC2VQT5_9TREE|nr:hypothetical protein QFC21_003107 [Naganishia friedmannii]
MPPSHSASSSSTVRSPPLQHRPLKDSALPDVGATAMIPSRALTSVNHLPTNGHSLMAPASPDRRTTASSAIRHPSPHRGNSFGMPGTGHQNSLSTVSMRAKHHWDDKDLQEMIDDEPMSKRMESIPLEDEDIKRLPKKMRKYYEDMAALKEAYEEVDALLASSLPSAIVTSFKPAASAYGGLLGEIEQDFMTTRAFSKQSDRQAGLLSIPRETGGRAENEREDGQAREDEPLLPNSQQREEKRERVAKLALNVNFTINIILLVSKGFAVLSSTSISLVASFIDSALDFLSTLIILFTSIAMGRQSDRAKYPVGKARFENLGVLIFSVAMIASFVQVFIESFQRAVGKQEEQVAELSWIGMATMVATIVIKGIVWVWCSRIPSTAVKALAQDAENDVFFNIMSLSFPAIGQWLKSPLLDPIGGMVLSVYIIWQWCLTLHENFINLSGRQADRRELMRVLYLASRFRAVLAISAVEVYHIGDEVVIEIDVILPRTSTLHYAHDIGETIQGTLERYVDFTPLHNTR